LTEDVHPGALAGVGWSDRVAALFTMIDPHLLPARVTRVDRDRCRVMTAAGESEAQAAELPAVGDWVALRHDPDDPTSLPQVAEVLPRWSSLARHAAGNATTEQVMAANVDRVLVVTGLDNTVRPNRVERELVVAWDSGARPAVVLTKADRCTDPGGPEGVRKALADRVGVDVVLTSAVDGQGIDQVRELIEPTETVVLIGASGVGKSTLVNRLLGADVQDTGAVRLGDSKGRHTTIARHLLAMPGGGVLIDSPGTRELGLLDASEGLALAFADIEDFAVDCRFTDCAHQREPGCAVQEAIAAGKLSAERFESWVKLGLEAARAEARLDARAKAEQHRQAQIWGRARKNRPPDRP
jgi:ribosome biogenesis GTPase